MAQNTTAVTLGEGTTTFAAGSRMFIVGQGGTTALAASSTAATTSNPWTTSANVTARDCTIKASHLIQQTEGTNPTVILDNCTIMMDSFANQLFLVTLTATRCTFMFTGTAGTGWGIYGNAGNAPPRVRTWTLNDCVFMTETPGVGYFLLNALDPDNSVLNNVRFQSADGTRGTYIEQSPLDAVGNDHGDFFRDDLGALTGDHVLTTVTGGAERDDRDRATGFIMQPQVSLATIASFNQNKFFAVDGNVNLWLPNLYLPANFNGNNLIFPKRQNSGTAGGGDDAGEFNIGHTWNPDFQDSNGISITTPRLFWNDGDTRASGQFRVFPMPATKSNAPGANDLPTAAASGFTYGNSNGLFLREYNFVTTSTAGSSGGSINSAYIDKPIRVYDYNTQVDAEIGQTITPKMPGLGETLATTTDNTVLVNEMTRTGTAIGYSSTDVRAFTIDANIPADLTEAVAAGVNDETDTAPILDFENWYGVVKQAYIAGDRRPTATWPFAGSNANVLELDRGILFTNGGSSVINSGSIHLPVPSALNAIGANSLKNTLRVTNASRSNWSQLAFPDGIIIEGGIHDFNANTRALNGVNWTAGAATEIEFSGLTAGSTHQFGELMGNLTVADGVVVAVDSIVAITIQGTQTQFDMIDVSGSTATITLDPQVAGVDINVAVQESANFGGTDVNFDGWIYVVENFNGLRTEHSAPVLVTDTNRGNTFFSINTSTIPALTSYEIYTAGARWNLARTVITNATTNAAPVATIIANTLYLPDATAVGTVDSVALQPLANDTLLVTTSGITDGSSEASNNRLAGDIKQISGDYIQSMGLLGRTVDAVQYTSANAVPPTFDISVITGATGDNTIQSWVGVGQTGTGTLAQTQQVNTSVWTLPNGTQGAQPSAINASVREAIDSAGVATRQDVIDNTEPLL